MLRHAPRRMRSRRLTIDRFGGNELSPEQLDALWRYHHSFVERSRESFESGIRSASTVDIVRDGERIRGFVALQQAELNGSAAIKILWAFLDAPASRRRALQRILIRAFLSA